MIGSDFEIRVWETLLQLPLGKATTYSDIAAHIGRPTAARAVGAAVGKNPISFVVPCHRVLGKGGGLCGYHWGLTRKRAILGWEAGVVRAGVEVRVEDRRGVGLPRFCLILSHPISVTPAPDQAGVNSSRGPSRTSTLGLTEPPGDRH